ncbi:hypothetical protein NFHSH190041_19230 [Shewanella sp. NFH-SH190041]|nr:hypothetical protein NFHSH190041_19230 [Shewanella sp. NFH-SH190041]
MNAQLNALFDDLFQVEAVGTNQFDLNLTDSCDEDVVGVGSQFTPRFKILQKMITELQGKLTQYRAFEASKTLSSLFEYHNNYTLYTLYMIINATGYRAVGNPLPSFNLFLNRYHALCISDKDNMTTFAHMRVVACVPVLGRQLNHYLDHIKAMARLMSIVLPNYAEQYKRHSSPVQFTDLKSKNARLDWFINAKNSKGNDGLFLFFDLISSGKVNVVNAYPKSVSEHSKGLPELPINFGRHYLRRYLQLKDVHQELVKFQMGHWVVGENPLELFSTLNFKEAIMSLNSVLQQMMDELGWQDIPSLLTRKRV